DGTFASRAGSNPAALASVVRVVAPAAGVGAGRHRLLGGASRRAADLDSGRRIAGLGSRGPRRVARSAGRIWQYVFAHGAVHSRTTARAAGAAALRDAGLRPRSDGRSGAIRLISHV